MLPLCAWVLVPNEEMCADDAYLFLKGAFGEYISWLYTLLISLRVSVYLLSELRTSNHSMPSAGPSHHASQSAITTPSEIALCDTLYVCYLSIAY